MTMKSPIRLLLLVLLVGVLGGCAEVGSALWLSGVAFTTLTDTAPGVYEAVQKAPESDSDLMWWVSASQAEPRVGSTRGSWTGVCDPVCPKVTHE